MTNVNVSGGREHPAQHGSQWVFGGERIAQTYVLEHPRVVGVHDEGLQSGRSEVAAS